MIMKEIKTDEDYQAALEHLEQLMTIAKDREGEPLLDEINIVADAIEQYEKNIPSVKRYLKEMEKFTEEDLLKHITPETAHADDLAELSSKEYSLDALLEDGSSESVKLDQEDKEWLNDKPVGNEIIK